MIVRVRTVTSFVWVSSFGALFSTSLPIALFFFFSFTVFPSIILSHFFKIFLFLFWMFKNYWFYSTFEISIPRRCLNFMMKISILMDIVKKLWKSIHSSKLIKLINIFKICISNNMFSSRCQFTSHALCWTHWHMKMLTKIFKCQTLI